MNSDWPLSTGDVFRLLQVPEHRLTVLIRLGKLDVPLVCGRRAWGPDHVLRAAKLVGRDTPAVRNLCLAATKPSSGGTA